MLMDAHWMRLEPLVDGAEPKGKTAPKDLRRTISAIVSAACGSGRGSRSGARLRPAMRRRPPASWASSAFCRRSRLAQSP